MPERPPKGFAMTTDSNDNDANGSSAFTRPLRDGIDTVSTKAGDAAELAREKASRALDAAKDGLEQARETLSDAYASGRGKATDLYSSSRDRAGEAYAKARERLRSAGDDTSEKLDSNPLAAVIGGIAIGVAVGALLPRTERETKVLGGVGKKLNGLALEALDAAKGAGQAKLADLGLTPDKARESFQTLIDGVLVAATSAGTAAVDTTRAQAKPAAGG
jgi:ElaB/YqjD/DUF883 family membrane-anchored ribosome-binding protein